MYLRLFDRRSVVIERVSAIKNDLKVLLYIYLHNLSVLIFVLVILQELSTFFEAIPIRRILIDLKPNENNQRVKEK